MTEYTANELRRIIAMIPQVDPTTTDYHILLQSLECFAGIADSIEEIMEQVGEPDAAEGTIIKVEFRPEAALAVQPAPEDTVHPDFPPEPESPFPETNKTEEAKPETEPQEPEPEQTYDLVTVRRAMREAKKNGVDILAALRSLGATNLTDLPAEKYPELMKKLEA